MNRWQREVGKQSARKAEIAEQIRQTRAQGLAGAVVRQRILAIDAMGSEGDPDRQLFVLALLRELETLAGMEPTTVVEEYLLPATRELLTA